MDVFAGYNLNTQEINLELWKNLFQALKQNVKIPAPSDLKNIILTCYEDMIAAYATEQFVPVLFIQGCKLGENVIYVSMLMSRSKTYYYVKHMVPDESDDLVQSFDDFCSSSIQKVSTTYDKKITGIIVDVDSLLPNSYFQDSHRHACILSRPFSYLLNDLLKGGAVVNFEEPDRILKYTSRVTEIKKKCLDIKTSVADAVHMIYESIVDKTLKVNPSCDDILEAHLGPLQYGCHNLNYKYEKEILNFNQESAFSSASFKVHDFLTFMIPNNAFEWHYYESKSKIFEYIVKSNVNDLAKYWELSLREFPTLGNLALDVMNIPAVPKKVDILGMYKLIFEHARAEKSEIEYRLNMFLKRF